MSDGHVTTESFSLIQDCFCQKFKIWSLFFLHFFIRDFYIWLVMFDGLYFKIFSYSWIGIFWYSLLLSKKNLYRIEIINVSPNTIHQKYLELSKISTTYLQWFLLQGLQRWFVKIWIHKWTGKHHQTIHFKVNKSMIFCK